MTKGSLQRRRDNAPGSGAELFYDTPLEMVRGEGVYLYDRDGRRYGPGSQARRVGDSR